ncbi:glycine cleavage system protein GcvH [Candidatus Poribacteria bacterium]|nr:glycine cleavage system protein GcvH [Candidatus Poribacteria bacterium]
MFPEDLKYMESHEWARREDDIVVVGVTDYAQGEIQDVVYVEMPEVGTIVEQKKGLGVIESVKAAFDLYAPVSGEVIEINEELEDTPELVNEDAYGSGWMIKIRMSNPGELDNIMSANEYQGLIEAEGNE